MSSLKRILSVLFFTILSVSVFSQTVEQLRSKKVKLPNGWELTPVGKNITLGDLPLNLIVSNNKKYLAVSNNGQSKHTIDLIDREKGIRLDSIGVPRAWYGLAFSSNDKYLYVAGGHENMIYRYEIVNNKLKKVDDFVLGKKWPNRISPAGITIDEARNRLYVVTKYNNSLYVVDLKTKNIIKKDTLNYEAYTCLLSPDKSKLYISLWGNKKVLVYDTKTDRLINEIAVGDHPNELIQSKNGRYVFVANSNDNSVSVIDTRNSKVIQTLNAALYPNSPSGSTSNGLALSEDEKTLYVANADNNCLAVFDISTIEESRSKGFIPVGWYPTNVKVVDNNIYVTNGKGLSSLPNRYGPNPAVRRQTVTTHEGDLSKPREVEYIAGLFKGTLSTITTPNPVQLAAYTQAVYQNTPYSKAKEAQAHSQSDSPIPMKVGDKSPIKYVFYIIKENRTYDQVLSDVPGGNGDTSLLLFGERITPNQHKIVKDFVLLDNFYVDAEVSADGHNWSMGAYANDYLEKTWPTSYGGRGGDYGGEGNRVIANNKDGFIWDLAKRSGVTFRTYGEFADKGKANIPVLEGHVAPYTGYDLSVPDTARFYQWQKDFDSLVAANALPQLTTLRFGNDHTEGMRAGRKTPFAHVADNDLAVGMFIEHLSHSPVWKESVVFILEDDAQNGPDHVDAHRSTAYVVGPYVKRNHIDHTMYSTSGMLRTIELILGMPPMTQYDAAATPMVNCFMSTPDYTPFKHLPANVDLNERNPSDTPLAILSEQFDWSKEDAVPDLIFNDILWLGIKGKPAPAPTRAAFLNIVEKDKD